MKLQCLKLFIMTKKKLEDLREISLVGSLNSRWGRLKGPKDIQYIYIYNMGPKLDSFLRKGCFLFCFVQVVLLISLDIMRKKITSVGLSYKDVILFSKIIYLIDVIYVKLNSTFMIIFGSKSRGNTVEKAKGCVL